MPIIEVRGDIDRALRQFERSLSLLDAKALKAVLSRAERRAMTAGRAMATRIARVTYTARANKLFDAIFVSRHPEDGGGTSVLHIEGSRGVHRIHFKASPKTVTKRRPARGVSTQIKRGGRRYVPTLPGYDKPFIARRKQGDYGMFFRKSGTGKEDQWGNIEQAWGPSPIQALLPEEAQDQVMDRIQETFEKRLAHEIDALLAGVTRS